MGLGDTEQSNQRSTSKHKFHFLPLCAARRDRMSARFLVFLNKCALFSHSACQLNHTGLRIYLCFTFSPFSFSFFCFVVVVFFFSTAFLYILWQRFRLAWKADDFLFLLKTLQIQKPKLDFRGATTWDDWKIKGITTRGRGAFIIHNSVYIFKIFPHPCTAQLICVCSIRCNSLNTTTKETRPSKWGIVFSFMQQAPFKNVKKCLQSHQQWRRENQQFVFVAPFSVFVRHFCRELTSNKYCSLWGFGENKTELENVTR